MSADDGGDLSVTVGDGVALLEMRRPPANHFDELLIGRLVDAAAGFDDDPACRVIVLASQGKHFCAGADFGGGDFARDQVAAAERRGAQPARRGSSPRPGCDRGGR